MFECVYTHTQTPHLINRQHFYVLACNRNEKSATGKKCIFQHKCIFDTNLDVGKYILHYLYLLYISTLSAFILEIHDIIIKCHVKLHHSL